MKVGLLDYSSSETQVPVPALQIPAVGQSSEEDLQLRVQAIVAEEAEVCEKKDDDVGRASDDVVAGLLLLDKESEDVDECGMTCGANVEVVDLPIVFNESCEEKDVVEIEAESGIALIDECVDALPGAWAEVGDGESEAFTAIY